MADVHEEIDRAPETAKKQEEECDMLPPPPEGSSWKVYLKPYWWTILLSHNKLLFGLNITFYYLVQFIGCVTVVNLYSDRDRLLPCATTGTLANPEEASKVFDLPLLMLAIWHMIEWIRTTILLTVVCIGVNWSIAWYVTMPNTLFGIVVYAMVHMSYFSDDGKACADVQTSRATWLLVEIIAFWVLFFVYSFPFLFTLCLGKQRANNTLNKAYEKAKEGEDEE